MVILNLTPDRPKKYPAIFHFDTANSILAHNKLSLLTAYITCKYNVICVFEKLT